MRKLIIFAVIGFFAQLIDGALGMAYGVTSSSLLLTLGIAPAVASASIHLAEVVTTAASGVSHVKFGNVDRSAVYKLIIPGSVGAFTGACFLSSLPGDAVKPFISLFLFILGIYVLFRFLFKFNPSGQKKSIDLTRKQSIALGLVAGFADATGGGGWGPITTPVLLSKKGASVRKTVGTVDTSEFAIAVSATAGFLISLGWEEVNWTWTIALMLGGIAAAPIAAWLVRILPAYLLGVLVGGFIIITNVRTLILFWSINGIWSAAIYTILLIGWGLSIFYAVRHHRKNI
ncbi:sulfite exporter TauE/SafE family protein [Bacillus swezeyi]|uniref:Probable membrane transporter protein n=1 Tax=Bacillus swezeyi TaxID=1925020 RepID=A0A1R1QLN4_9BACI|nr:sulfite exporter TauE/SafE family protein [Bacillus swezeyi]MEC1262777.1 sulfite exporter TauE/SafE family protein [Bacillus swezeyi]MED2928620.1 sulfite exporter TauE/SafE family protein [Bacillus swezeyi]MED2945246.1 sulfite exporter TauE/SafE family protein [Bacillus swezeyi]MED2962949.1 sulfite exporter TauE/SafE family protein [Bacillus swezeyi]MED2975841.1 sulfite exporter TauE/SafE family protein [Bacillus swezeyi]